MFIKICGKHMYNTTDGGSFHGQGHNIMAFSASLVGGIINLMMYLKIYI